MAWLQLTLECDREHAEQLAGLLERYGAMSVSLSAVSDEAVFSELPGQEPRFWDHTHLSALLHEDTDLDTLLVCLRDHVGGDNISRQHIDRLADRDWVSEYQQNNGPRWYGERLCIMPSWCEQATSSAARTLVLDPGLAFGTGSHVTTTLCLDWLTGVDLTGKTVIDYGCGSGILGLAAAMLGAARVFAVDIDPQALAATRNNAALNDIDEIITIAAPDSLTLPAADILVANILLKPLQALAPEFADYVAPAGRLALSGILANQAEECLAAYAAWFNMQTPVYSREWAFLEGFRNQQPPAGK